MTDHLEELKKVAQMPVVPDGKMVVDRHAILRLVELLEMAERVVDNYSKAGEHARTTLEAIRTFRETGR